MGERRCECRRRHGHPDLLLPRATVAGRGSRQRIGHHGDARWARAIDYAGNGGNTLPMFPADSDMLMPPATTDKNGTRGAARVNVVRVGSQHLPRRLGRRRCWSAIARRTFRTLGGTGKDEDENNGYIDGWDWDTIRWSFEPFSPDRFDDALASREFGSSHPSGVNFLYADGGVRQLAYGMSLEVFRRLSDRNDAGPLH